MAGSDQSVNLGGMLSQMGTALGSMGKAGDGLTRSIEGSFMPNVDPNDPESLRRMMQWQNSLGRTDEAAVTMGSIRDMETERRAKAKAEKESLEKRQILGFRQAYQRAKNAGDQAQMEKIKQSAGAFSQQSGIDVMSGINQVDQIGAAEEARERAAQQFQWQKDSKEREQLDQQVRSQWLQAGEEQKEQLRTEMEAKGMGGTLMVLENYDRSVVSWEEARANSKRSADERALAPITSGERKVIDSALTEAEGTNEKYAKAIRAQITSIEEDPILSNSMKREKIDKFVNSIHSFNLNQASAEAAAGRKAASLAEGELDTPPQWQVKDMTKLIEERDLFFSYLGAGKKAQELNDLIESVDKDDLARVAAAIKTTSPQTSTEAAIRRAVELLSGAPTTKEPASDDSYEPEEIDLDAM